MLNFKFAGSIENLVFPAVEKERLKEIATAFKIPEEGELTMFSCGNQGA